MENSETFVHDVVEFNREILGIEQRSLGPLSASEGTHLEKCLDEELLEFYTGADLVHCVDALIDLMYVAVGGLYKMGLTVEQIVACQKAVHEANMTKKKGVLAKRAVEGAADAVKPEGWIAPEERIKAILGI